MFKLVKGEFKKVFHQPLVYIMAIILALSLIASLFLFKPVERKTSASSFSLVSSSVSEAKQNFANKKVEIDTGVENLKKAIQDYKVENKSLLLQNYKNSNNQTLSDLFTIYNNNCTNPSGINLETLNTNLQNLNNALKEINEIYADIIGTTIPTVKLSIDTNDQITFNLKNAIEETTLTSSLNLEAHKKINETLNNKNYNKLFKTLFSRISDVGLSQENINNIISTYIEKGYSEKQSVIETAIANATTQEEVFELAKKYNANAYALNQIVYLKVYSNMVQDLQDGEIQSLFNGKILNQKTNFSSETATKYSINEKLTYYSYLWDNNLYDFEFATATNGLTTSNDSISAIDYAVYAFQISSFIIIIYSVIVAASSISNEMNFGTLKMLATKPITRSSIVKSKLTSTFLVGLVFSIFAAVVSFVLGIVTFGYNGATILTVFNGSSIIKLNPIVYLLILVLSELIKLFVFITLSTFFSTLFKNSIPSLIISLVIFFAGSILSTLLPTANFLAFIPFFNLDLFVYFGGCSLISIASPFDLLFSATFLNNSNIFLTLGFVIVLPILFIILSVSIFKKRDII